MFESNYLLIMGLSGIVISLLIILHEPIFDGIDRIVARITVKKVLKKIDLYNGKKYSLQGTTQGNGLTGGLPPVRFSM